MTDVPFTFVINELLATAQHSTNETEAALYSLLKAVGANEEHELEEPVTALAAYSYVDAVLANLGIAPHTLKQYRTLANQKVQFYSRGY